MSISNKPDIFVSVKCTECTNVFSRAVKRGRPRLTCSDECRRTRASLQRRNQGDRTDPNARHAPDRGPKARAVEATQPADTADPLVQSVDRLQNPNRTLKRTLERTTAYLPKLRRKDEAVIIDLIIDAKELRLAVEEVLKHKPQKPWV